jgi:hypothetical protein
VGRSESNRRGHADKVPFIFYQSQHKQVDNTIQARTSGNVEVDGIEERVVGDEHHGQHAKKEQDELGGPRLAVGGGLALGRDGGEQEEDGGGKQTSIGSGIARARLEKGRGCGVVIHVVVVASRRPRCIKVRQMGIVDNGGGGAVLESQCDDNGCRQ